MRRGVAVLGLGLALAAGGCDWRDFDALQASAPVLAVEPPSGYPSSNDFASLLVATQPPTDGSAAARFVTSGTLQTALTVVTLTPGGAASTQLIGSNVLNVLGGQPVTAMAAIPGTDKLLLAGGWGTMTLDLSTSPPLANTSGINLTAGLPDVGVAAGDLGGAAAADLVVVAQSSVQVFLDGASTAAAFTGSTTCPITLASSVPMRDRFQRAVVVGRRDLVGSAAGVIAVGTPAPGTSGNVSFFTVDAGGVACQFSIVAPATAANAGEFGRSLAIGDFDGDGVSDLIVGAPPDHAFLFRGPIAAGAAPAGTFANVASGGYTGASVAALNVDGKGADEALVGDPDGAGTAGQVVQLTGPMLATVAATLADHSGGANDGYGASVAALPFCATSPCAKPQLLPLVGAANKAFVYFTLSGTDLRAR
jgi:FG-GAP repeat